MKVLHDVLAPIIEENATSLETAFFISGGREATLFESDLKTSESSLLLKETGCILDVSVCSY